MSHHVTVSTAYQGQHRDWTIESEAMTDHAMFRHATEDLYLYLRASDGELDSGGSFISQVEKAIDATCADGKGRNLTLAATESDDFEVFVRRVED